MMKKILILLISLGLVSSINAARLGKAPVNTSTLTADVATPIAEPVDDIIDSSSSSDTTLSSNAQDFTFVNNLGAPATVSVLTDLTLKPQVITISSKKKSVIRGECLYYVKVTSGKYEIVVIPGLPAGEKLPETFMFSEKNKLCVSSTFQITKSSNSKVGIALNQVFATR